MSRSLLHKPRSAPVENVANGRWLAKVCQIPFSPKEWRATAATLALSGREFEIVRGLSSGKRGAAIAQDLELSINTVHTHVKRLYRKIGVTNRSGLLTQLFASCLAIHDAAPRNGRSAETAAPKFIRVKTVPCLGVT